MCNSSNIHYLWEFSQDLRHGCAIDFHEKCKWNETPDSKSVAYSLNAAKSLLNSNHETYEQLKASLDEEFKMYSEILANIDEKVHIYL